MSGKIDALIIGSGANALAAGIYLQQKGLTTRIIERADVPGGSTRSLELTLPGFIHDIGSSIHPLTRTSPFFSSLPLKNFGLEWIHPEIPFAHPLDDGEALAAYKNIDQTASQFGVDKKTYIRIFDKLVQDWDLLKQDILGPLSWPGNFSVFWNFLLNGFPSAKKFIHSNFKNDATKVFFYGAAAHSTLPLDYLVTAGFGIVLLVMAHKLGWPFPKGGAGNITKALAAYYESRGGQLVFNHNVNDLKELPEANIYLLDQTPSQILEMKGTRFTRRYRRRLANYSYGAGVFKMDWSLNEPIPFTNELCRKAGTIHLGYSWEKIADSERLVHRGKMTEDPYVILAQHSVFDSSRTPGNKHTAWAYCHVPHGERFDRSAIIENQIEKAAPGFRDCILHKTIHNCEQLETFNPNLVGGDINGGKQNITQLFTRPVARWSPYTTPDRRVYICSSSTPPGGGVHGMCGYHAARKAFKDHFDR
jgi:phytoene dehydrogenase-like protein